MSDLRRTHAERLARAEAAAAALGLTIVRDPLQCELRRGAEFVSGLPVLQAAGIELTVVTLVESLLRELGRPGDGKGNA